MRTSLATLLLLILGVGGLASASAQGTPSYNKTELLTRLDRRAPAEVVGWQSVETTTAYEKWQVHLKVESEQRRLVSEVAYYQARQLVPGATTTPWLLLYAGIGGGGRFETMLAEYFARNGISVVLSHHFNAEQAADPHLHNQEAYDALLVSFAITDFFSQRPELAPEQLGLLGVSYGGLRGVFHTLLDGRIKGAVLLVAGGSLPEILAYSTLPQVVALRQQQQEALGLFDTEAYLAYLRSCHTLRVEDLVGLRAAQDFYLFIAKNDPWVPSSEQWRLWEILGQPPYQAFAAGHVMTPLLAGLTQTGAMIEFFAERWGGWPGVVPVSDYQGAVDPW